MTDHLADLPDSHAKTATRALWAAGLLRDDRVDRERDDGLVVVMVMAVLVALMQTAHAEGLGFAAGVVRRTLKGSRAALVADEIDAEAGHIMAHLSKGVTELTDKIEEDE